MAAFVSQIVWLNFWIVGRSQDVKSIFINSVWLHFRILTVGSDVAQLKLSVN